MRIVSRSRSAVAALCAAVTVAVLAVASPATAAPVSPAAQVTISNGIWVINTVGPDGVLQYGFDRVVDVAGWSFDDRGRVHMWDFRNNGNFDNQRWNFINLGQGLYQIKNKNSSKCLDKSMDNGNVDGALVYQFSCAANHPSNQVWYLDNLGLNGYLRIRSWADNRCLDIRGKVDADDATVQVYGCNSTGWNQAWAPKYWSAS